VKNSTSDLLIANCDEFIYYDDLVREKKKASARRSAPREGGAAKPRAGGRKAAPAAVEAAGAVQAAAGGTTGEAAVHAATGGTDAASAGEAAGESTRDEAARRDDAVDLVVETVEALLSERGADEKIWGSMVKQALKRVKPGFNEAYYGFRSFNAVLEEAARRGELALDRDEKSGGYIVRLVPGED
jgi:hypothetical protein